MKDFPQELVDQVIDELFILIERDDQIRARFERFWNTSRVPNISDYSLVSRAWAGPTQKHHFSSLSFDSMRVLERWCTHIAPDPAGLSRHVRKLVLDYFDSSELEGFENHLRAFTQVECLTVNYCDGVLQLPSVMEWFQLMGSSLVELRIHDSPVTPHTIASLLAALPLLQGVEVSNFKNPDKTGEAEDTKKTSPPIPSRIPFFEGANRFRLRSDYGREYPKGSLDWIPSSARFAHLEIDMACSLHHPDLVNQWLASSRTTLTKLAIREDRDARIPNELTPLNFLQCTGLESFRVPVFPSVATIFPHETSSQLPKVILDFGGMRDITKLGSSAWEAIEKRLCLLAKQFSEAHPGRRMVVEITGRFGKHPERIRVLRTLNDRKFLPKLKEEAKVVIPCI